MWLPEVWLIAQPPLLAKDGTTSCKAVSAGDGARAEACDYMHHSTGLRIDCVMATM
jgi:hypothetical protein